MLPPLLRGNTVVLFCVVAPFEREDRPPTPHHVDLGIKEGCEKLEVTSDKPTGSVSGWTSTCLVAGDSPGSLYHDRGKGSGEQAGDGWARNDSHRQFGPLSNCVGTISYQISTSGVGTPRALHKRTVATDLCTRGYRTNH